MSIEIYNEDCIAGMRERLPGGSVDLLVTSIPFGALFSYSHKAEDVGNCRDGVDFIGTQFGLNMRFWFAEVARVMAPGCIVCIHVQQLNTTIIQHGAIGIRDFRGAVIDMGRLHGLTPQGEFAIPKNPQLVAQRRHLNTLAFMSARADSRRLAPCNNDYVLIFRKPGEGRPVPGMIDPKHGKLDGNFTARDWIKWAKGTWSDGWRDERWMNDLEGYREALDAYLQQEWRSSSVWEDIIETDVLEGWRGAKGSDEEKHVCPLQRTVIRRCLLLYSNPGDLVIDPFMGIGSTAVECVELDRECRGWELKESYHRMAVRNVERWQEKKTRGSEQAALALYPEVDAAPLQVEVGP